MNLNSKRGQVTIFIVAGIIILLVATIFIYISSRQTTRPFEEFQPRIIEIPLEFKPVNDFIENCLKTTTAAAFEFIGRTGGYYNTNPLSATFAPTEGSAFYFNPNDVNSKIAYWWYFKSANNCQQNCECGTERPHLYVEEGEPSIESEVAAYINDHLDDCLNNFNSLKQQGFEFTELSVKNAKVRVAENDVAALLDYSIKIRKDTSEQQIDQFFVRIPLNFRKIYEMASEVVNAELNFTVFDRWTNYLVSGFGLGFDQEGLAPMYAAELNPGESPKYWSKYDLKNKLKNNILPAYIPLFQVYRSANYQDRGGSIYEIATLPLISPSGDDFSNLKFNFEYLNLWDIYFEVTGRGVSNDLVGPESASVDFFAWLGMQRYNLYYDVSYPIKVEIMDISPELQPYYPEGYKFDFGVEANVRDNKEINCTGEGLDTIKAFFGTQFCQSNQGCANITLELKDAKTNEALDNVQIYYGAGESCMVGLSSNGMITASLPSCIGACYLKPVLNDYFSPTFNYAVRCDNQNCGGFVLCGGEQLPTIYLEPYREKNFTIMKKAMVKQNGDWVFDSTPRALLDNEYARISLERIKETTADEDVIAVGVYDQGNQNTMKLVPGRYMVSVDLLYRLPDVFGRTEVLFPEEERCEGGILGIGESCVTLPEIRFNDTFIEGSVSYNVMISRELLDNHNSIVFYAFSSPDVESSYPFENEDLEEMGKADEYMELYRGSFISPGFID